MPVTASTLTEANFAPTVNIDQVDDLLRLQKAAQKITSELDLDKLIDNVVDDVVRSFGFLETNIYLHDEAKGELLLAGVCGCTCNHKGHTLKVGTEGMVGYVAATGQMRYAPDVRLDPYYIPCEKDTLSEVAIPLVVDGKLVGVFSSAHPELDAFAPDQLRLLQALCVHISVAINNARRFQKEREQREHMSREANEARAIQQALLPKASPWIPGFKLCGLSIPAGAVGGDWYDFIPMSNGKLGIVLADVAGKGTAAALLMSATRGMLRSLAEANCSPAEVLTKLNNLLVEDFPAGRFVTLVYGVLDPATRNLTFASAGHLPPLLIGSQSEFIGTDRGLPLGIARGSYSESIIDLPVGSRLVFYSDGITEATNNDEEYGPERLRSHVSEREASAESILQDVREFADGFDLQDDATVIFLQA